MNRTHLFYIPLALLVLSTPPAQATTADDLCAATDDPCVVSKTITVDPSATLDFGARTLSIVKRGVLKWSTNLTLTAGNCDFKAKSKIVEVATSPGTGFLWMNCGSSTLAGKITTVGSGVLVEGPGPHVLSGTIYAQGPQVGVIAIDDMGAGPPGGITVTGTIFAKSTTGTPPGEFRLWSDFGNILITKGARITAKGATADPFDNFFLVEAGSGALTLLGHISAGATVGGYEMHFEANEDVLFGPSSIVNGTGKHTGAVIGINSQLGRVALQGQILASVSKLTGQGAGVGICASSDIIIDGGAQITTSDGSSQGSIIIGAGGKVQVGTALKGARLLAKNDGDIEICSGGGNSIATKSVIKPDPNALGSIGECLSPSSPVHFDLDCNQ